MIQHGNLTSLKGAANKYYRARYYDPSIGRFLSEDPKGFSAGINFYVYASNDPIDNNDPSGQCGPLTPLCAAIAAAWETAPIWGPPVLEAGSDALAAVRTGWAAWTATTATVGTEATVAAGTIGATASTAGYYATTRNPTPQGAAFAAGNGAAQGLLTLYAPGTGTFKQGMAIAGVGDLATQGFNMWQGTQNSFNSLEFLVASLTGGGVSKFTGVAGVGTSVGEQASIALPAWGVTTSATAVAQKLGEPSGPTPSFTDFGSPSLDFSNFANAGGAAGGFLIYPNKANLNQLRSVYAK